jgi:hypothetical protein
MFSLLLGQACGCTIKDCSTADLAYGSHAQSIFVQVQRSREAKCWIRHRLTIVASWGRGETVKPDSGLISPGKRCQTCKISRKVQLSIYLKVILRNREQRTTLAKCVCASGLAETLPVILLSGRPRTPRVFSCSCLNELRLRYD